MQTIIDGGKKMRRGWDRDTVNPAALSDWSAAEYLKLYRESLTELIRLADHPEEEKEYTREGFYYLFNTLKDDICRKCVRFRSCFGEDRDLSDAPVYELVCRELFSDAPIPEKADTRPDGCIYYDSIKEELIWLKRLLFQNRFWKSRFYDIRRAFKSSLVTQKVVLDECIRGLESDEGIKRSDIRKLNRSLFPGALVRSGRQRKDQDGNLEMLLDLYLLRGWKVPDITERISKAYGQTLTCLMPEEWAAAGSRRLKFSDTNTFSILFGKCHRNKTGETVCGDTFSFVHKGNGQVLLCLSDGMGTGEKARLSSARLLETFESLALAGVAEETAVDMLHSVLYLQTGNESSTLDIASVSLRTGVARFIKAGGAATFIRRRRKVERLCNAGLPPGILEGNDRSLQCYCRKLYDGDMIVMLSDGMLAFENHKEETMENLIARIGTDNAQTFADRLMELIPEPPGGTDDDRTVLVAVVRERRNMTNVG